MVSIISDVKEVATSAAESVTGIASVAEENSAATEQVSASSEEMSAQVEEVTASTLELGRLADSLNRQLSTFDLGGDDSASPTVHLAEDEAEEELAA